MLYEVITNGSVFLLFASIFAKYLFPVSTPPRDAWLINFTLFVAHRNGGLSPQIKRLFSKSLMMIGAAIITSDGRMHLKFFFSFASKPISRNAVASSA